MDGVLGALLIAAGILGYTLTLLAVRNPRGPAWLSDGLVANLILPLELGLLAAGAGLLGRFLTTMGSRPLSPVADGAVLALLVATLLAPRLLRVRRRLAGYAQGDIHLTAVPDPLQPESPRTPPPRRAA